MFPDEELRAFVSDVDIDSGEDWHQNIREHLIVADCGIVVLTQDNKTAPWLNFESGCIAVGSQKGVLYHFL